MRGALLAAIGAVSLGLLSAFLIEGVMNALLAQTLVLVCVGACVLVVGVWLNREKQISLLCDPFFVTCAFLAQFFVIGPLAWHAEGGVTDQLFAFQFRPERVVQVLVAFSVMMALAAMSYRLGLSRVVVSALPEFRGSSGKFPGRWAEVGLTGVGIAGCLGWVFFQGGLAAKLAMGYGAARTGGAMFRIGFMALQVGTLLVAWRVFSKRPARLLDRVLLVGLVGFQAVFFGVITGVRKYLFFMTFGLLTVWLLRRGRDALPKLRVGAALVLLVVFFSVWGSVRARPLTVLLGQESDARYAETLGASYGYLSGVAGPFSVTCLAWELFPDHEPHKHGRTLLVTLLAFVPRAVWPDKPVGIGKEMTRYLTGPMHDPVYGYSVTPTLLGDFYINLGWVGVVIGGLALGVLCRVVTLYATQGMRGGIQRQASRVLLPAGFIMGLGEVRADMATMLMTYTLTFIPLIGALALFRFDDQ